MICLADNDVIFKLAACNLLNEALAVLGLSRDEVFVLNTIKYQLQEARSLTRLATKYSVEGLERALEFVLSVREIESAPDLDDLTLLSSVEGIDAGEAVIFAATKSLDSFIVATGDKKALMALRNDASCNAICERLCGRIICFEKLVALILASNNIEIVKPKIMAALSCDIVLEIAFSFRMDTTLDLAMTALDSYINDLRANTGELLIV